MPDEDENFDGSLVFDFMMTSRENDLYSYILVHCLVLAKNSISKHT